VVAWIDELGEVFAVFDHQDSACVSYGLMAEGKRWFVKTAISAGAVPALERAVAFHRAVSHSAIIPLQRVINAPIGPGLVYPWVDGDVLYGAPTAGRETRVDPAGPHSRFRSLPLIDALRAVDAIFDAHLSVAADGFVAVDWYDGCIIYDFQNHTVHLCDLDEYRPGPFTVVGDRLPGSTRFMAPEELTSGATIDERTSVFNLGRTALVLLNEGDLDGNYRANTQSRRVAQRATRAEPADRYRTVAAFVAAWRAAVDG
jgi:serine/threonine-protein kinase